MVDRKLSKKECSRFNNKDDYGGTMDVQVSFESIIQNINIKLLFI